MCVCVCSMPMYYLHRMFDYVLLLLLCHYHHVLFFMLLWHLKASSCNRCFMIFQVQQDLNNLQNPAWLMRSSEVLNLPFRFLGLP